MSTAKRALIDNFLILQIADFISSFGSSMTSLALTAVIYTRTDSLTAAALFSLLTLLPQFIISPFISRAKIGTSFKNLFFIGEFVCVIPLVLLMMTDEILLIYVIYFAYCSVFFFLECFRAEYLKRISNDGNIQSRQGISRFVNGLVVVIGPLAGGVILSRFGMRSVYTLDIVTYFIAAAVVLLMHGDEKPSVNERGRSADVLKTLKQNRDILSGSLLITFIGGTVSILTIEYIYKVISGDTLQYSVLMSAMALGASLGNLIGVIPFVSQHMRNTSNAAVILLGMLLLSVLFRPQFAVMAVILTLSGILSSIVMLRYATELFVRNSDGELRDGYLAFQNTIDSSNALSKPFGSCMNSVLGCVTSIAALGCVFIVFGMRLFAAKEA